MLFAGLRVMMINAVDIILLINFDSAEWCLMVKMQNVIKVKTNL